MLISRPCLKLICLNILKESTLLPVLLSSSPEENSIALQYKGLGMNRGTIRSIRRDVQKNLRLLKLLSVHKSTFKLILSESVLALHFWPTRLWCGMGNMWHDAMGALRLVARIWPLVYSPTQSAWPLRVTHHNSYLKENSASDQRVYSSLKIIKLCLALAETKTLE